MLTKLGLSQTDININKLFLKSYILFLRKKALFYFAGVTRIFRFSHKDSTNIMRMPVKWNCVYWNHRSYMLKHRRCGLLLGDPWLKLLDLEMNSARLLRVLSVLQDILSSCSKMKLTYNSELNPQRKTLVMTASFQLGTKGYFPGLNQSICEVYHSPPPTIQDLVRRWRLSSAKTLRPPYDFKALTGINFFKYQQNNMYAFQMLVLLFLQEPVLCVMISRVLWLMVYGA